VHGINLILKSNHFAEKKSGNYHNETSILYY
jgi:hypothetical protein